MSLGGSKVVVLGGSSGIGLAVAKAARDDGADVVIASRTTQKLDAARGALGEGVQTHAVDMTDEQAVSDMFAAVGSVDHLVITAAELGGGLVKETPANALKKAFDSRFWGSYYATQAAAPNMPRSGSITYFSGISAWKPFAGESVVAASACAMESFARTMAVELAPIRVNTVCPGIVDTPLLDVFFGDAREAAVAGLNGVLPVGRIGRPDEIADAVVFLMTNGYMTGVTLHVDGGHRLV